MIVYFVKKTHAEETPAGEMEVTPTGVMLRFNDYILMRVLKGLFSRSLCDKSSEGSETSKCLAKHKVFSVLSRLRRPYFMTERLDIPWKYSEALC